MRLSKRTVLFAIRGPCHTEGLQTPRVDLSQDRAWLDAYRRGDPVALERLFRCYAPLVFHLVRRGMAAGATRAFLLDAQEEEDVVQQVFVRLLQPATRARY